MTVVRDVSAGEILDSRGYPTIEVTVMLQDGTRASASVPSGASTGGAEAVEKRDGNTCRYGGKGVQSAVQSVERVIRPKLIGRDVTEQSILDGEMIRVDGSPTKETLGANAILGVSLALAKAAANSIGIPLYRYLGGLRAGRLPVPMMNIFNGGKHADNNVDIQECMIVPSGADTFSDALMMGVSIYHALARVLRKEGLSTTVGDEGGFAPDIRSNEDALRYVMVAIEEAGYQAGRDVYLALDVAASELYRDGRYYLEGEGRVMTADALIDYYDDLTRRYPICSIEDGLAEEDWTSWQTMTARLGGRCYIVGDDLFTTNPERIARGIEMQAANALLVKPNQIGTLTETIEAMGLAEMAGYATIISHRSGETADDFIADLAVGMNAPFIKTGAPARTERTAKYNRLLAIERELGDLARYAGHDL